MKQMFVTELRTGEDSLWVLYDDLRSQVVPRVGEYIRIHQKGIVKGWFLVKYVSYENYSYGGEYLPRVHLYVERVNGNPSFYRGSDTMTKRDESD